jgi:nitroreductase
MSDQSGEAAERVRPLIRVRQIRDFLDRQVAESELEAIADVARWSGSGGNRQPWRFIVLRDRATIKRIADAGMDGTGALQTAPAAIAIILPDDPERVEPSAYDEGRAAERILIGASVFGLGAGITWIVPEARDAVREILGLPGDWFPRTVVAIGYPSEEAMRPKSAPGTARLPRAKVVFEEKWPQD